MKKEQIQQFTLRITESNRTGLIAVLYDMIDVYLKDAEQARTEDSHEEFKKNVRGADRVLKELMGALDHKYEIAGNLYSLYVWCRERLAVSMVRFDISGIEEAKRVLIPLGNSFRELAKTDDSPPMMRNTARPVYGATYGKKDITEDFSATGLNRGFLA